MKIINIFFLIYLLKLFSYSQSFLLSITDNNEKYCFHKFASSFEQITLSFAVSSNEKLFIHVDLSFREKKDDPKNIIYEVFDKEQDNYESKNSTKDGYYELCFYSIKGQEFMVSTEFYSTSEGQVKSIATDKEVKNITKEVVAMEKQIFILSTYLFCTFSEFLLKYR